MTTGAGGTSSHDFLHWRFRLDDRFPVNLNDDSTRILPE